MQTLLHNVCAECGSLEIAYDASHEIRYCTKCGAVTEDFTYL